MRVNIPMKTSEILKFVQTGGDVEFDFADCPIKSKHAIQYIAFTKLPHTAVNYGRDVLIEFIKSPQLLGRSNLITDYKNLLCLHVHGHMWTFEENCLSEEDLLAVASEHSDLVEQCVDVLKSLPYFLAMKSGSHRPKNESKTSVIGVNFARFFEDPAYLAYMLADYLETDDWRSAPYFTSLFDDYKYGGDNLVWFVTNNPECGLIQRVFE